MTTIPKVEQAQVSVAAPRLRGTELRRRLLVTLGALVVYRAGQHVPLYGVDLATFRTLLEQGQGGGVFSSGALSRLSIFALGVMPLVSAMIVFEMARLLLPPFRRWQARDAGARALTGHLIVGLALAFAVFQSVGIAFAMEQVRGLVSDPGWEFRIAAVAGLAGGAAVSIALAQLIDRHGLGEGVWVLFVSALVMHVPQTILQFAELHRTAAIGSGLLFAIGAFYALTIVALVALDAGWSAAPKNGRTALNPGGLWPPLLAGMAMSLLLSFVLILVGVLAPQADTDNWLEPFGWQNTAGVAVLILLFCWLYARAEAERPGLGNLLDGAFARAIIPAGVLAAIWLASQFLVGVREAPLLLEGASLIVLVITLRRMLAPLVALPRVDGEARP